MKSKAAMGARGASRRGALELAARMTLPGTVALALMFELLLAERKFAIFGGGFGQSRTLDTPVEIGVFLIALLLCQALIFYLLFRFVRRLHGRRADTVRFYFNFLFFVLLGWCGALVAKYQALAYFSDAMSFQIIRNLGGGSLIDALLYVLSETGLILLVAGGAAVAYWLCNAIFLRRLNSDPPFPDRARLTRRELLLTLLILPLLLFGANRIEDTRSALVRFNAVLLWTTPLHQLTDFDRDGWSFYSHPIDRQPFDSTLHPYALDVPGNGIDEDGFGGDLSFTEPPPAAAPVVAGERPHVVLIVLESARHDVVDRIVDGRELMPTVNRIAANGSFAQAAYSHVGFTSFSLKSLFTGRLDPAPGGPSLVGDFLANGYEVGIFSGQSEDFGGIAETVGMRRASHFVDANTLREERAFSFAAEGSLYVDGRIVLREFDRHLGDSENWQTPQFLYFNFQSAHFPYHAPGRDWLLEGEPIARGDISYANRDRVRRNYWNAMAYNDVLVAELLERLDALGVRDNSLTVITSDHGQSLFEDGFLGHGHMLNEEQTRIPFIIDRPGIAIGRPVGLADMRSIILRAAGADVPAPQRSEIFQYLGTLEQPGRIGTVDGNGRWTVFDLTRQAVRVDDGPWRRYADLPRHSSIRQDTDGLIDRWARQRWLGVLERRDTQSAD